MKVAYFSPLPPKKTGVATYSAHLVEALAPLVDLSLFDTGQADAPRADVPVVDIRRHPEVLGQLDRFDVCLYHLGNNPWFHLDIYKTLLRHPGVVVLHDTILYFLVAGLGRGGLAKELCMHRGPDGLRDLRQIVADSPDQDLLRYPFPERHPLLTRTLAHAHAVVVHSHAAR